MCSNYGHKWRASYFKDKNIETCTWCFHPMPKLFFINGFCSDFCEKSFLNKSDMEEVKHD